MDITQVVLTIVGSVIGSGAVFGFIEFLIKRKDKKEEDDINTKFENVRKEFKTGLDEREATGKERYLEHKEAILDMSSEHKKDFQALLNAIEKLTENDTNTNELLKKNQAIMDTIADGVVGMIHNTILRSTQPILERGAVTYEELATLDSLYTPYAKLGGNGDCKRRYEDVTKLPKISNEEAILRDREMEIARHKAMQEE